MTVTARPKPPVRTPEQFVGSYGPNWKPGVLSEHLSAFMAAGGEVRTSASGRARWAMVGNRAYRVVCSEIVQVFTEDGPIDGRCGQIAEMHGCCESHGADLEAWRGLTEPERAAWERDRDGLARL